MVEIGYVARSHGVRGELKVVTHDPASTTLAEAEEVRIGADVFAVARARKANKFWILTLEGVSDRDHADALRGKAVEVSRDLIELDEGEVLLSDLVGLRALLPDGTEWGEVVSIESGPQDRLVIHQDQIERLLPFVPELVTDIDFEAETIVVSPPEGWPEAPVRRQR